MAKYAAFVFLPFHGNFFSLKSFDEISIWLSAMALTHTLYTFKCAYGMAFASNTQIIIKSAIKKHTKFTISQNGGSFTLFLRRSGLKLVWAYGSEMRKKIQTVSFNQSNITQFRMSWHLSLFLFGGARMREWNGSEFRLRAYQIEYNVFVV